MNNETQDAKAGSANVRHSRIAPPDKPLIQLWSARRFGIIVLRPSGVYYSNQTGGYACLHPMVEGIFVPLGDEMADQEKKLCDYFTGPKWAGWCCDGIDGETADFIDALMSKTGSTRGISVDRSRMRDSHEAWVYVDLRCSEEQPCWKVEVSGFGICKGVLTWENSD